MEDTERPLCGSTWQMSRKFGLEKASLRSATA
jgi:hypothetical protein